MNMSLKAYTKILESIITIQESHIDTKLEKTCLRLRLLLIHVFFINIQRVSLQTLQTIAVTALGIFCSYFITQKQKGSIFFVNYKGNHLVFIVKMTRQSTEGL